jgi:hypothetical protein
MSAFLVTIAHSNDVTVKTLADELVALRELALEGLRHLRALASTRADLRQRLAPALSILVRFALELGLSPRVEVELDEQLGIAAVMVDGRDVSPEQWLTLEKAGLPMLALRADETT